MEIDLISARNDFKQYAQSKLSNIVTRDKYQRALNEVEASGDKRCFQALGKAYILRPHEELKKDYESLIEESDKDLKTIEVSFSVFKF